MMEHYIHPGAGQSSCSGTQTQTSKVRISGPGTWTQVFRSQPLKDGPFELESLIPTSWTTRVGSRGLISFHHHLLSRPIYCKENPPPKNVCIVIDTVSTLATGRVTNETNFELGDRRGDVDSKIFPQR